MKNDDLLNPYEFTEICKKYGFTFFSGVPDSTFKSWIKFLERENNGLTNIISVNECEAAAVCAGYHIATGNIGVLYMQNDGFAKTVNPFTSFCNPEVYSIPILLIIGWRGQPERKDAVQHRKMGEILVPLLNLLNIPFEIIPKDTEKIDDIFKKAKAYMVKNNRAFAIIIRKNIFQGLPSENKISDNMMYREDALRTVVDGLTGNEIIVSTTGKISRELLEYRIEKNKKTDHDFYNVGAMGCAQSIGLGIALNNKEKKVFVFDGDGSLLMQMGGITTIGHYHPKNFFHLIFDNNAHDSTGGQPTCSDTVDFAKVALSCNYKFVKTVATKKSLVKAIKEMRNVDGPAMIVVKVRRGARKNLKRPDRKLTDYKKDLMKTLME